MNGGDEESAENSTGLDNLNKLLVNDGKEQKPTLVFRSRMINFAAEIIHGFRENRKIVESIRQAISNCESSVTDGAGNEKVDLDAALEIILGTKVAEEKKLHVMQMKNAVLKIEKLITFRIYGFVDLNVVLLCRLRIRFL